MKTKIKKQKKREQKFCHEAYKSELQLLLQYAYSEYKHMILERHATQISLVKNYLWISTVILGLYFSLFISFAKEDIAFFGNAMIWYMIAFVGIAIAIISSVATLVFGIDTLRGRSNTIIPFNDFENWIKLSYASARDGLPYTSALYTNLISEINKAIKERLKFIDFTGHRLRIMSKLLVLAVAISVFSGIVFLLIALNNKLS